MGRDADEDLMMHPWIQTYSGGKFFPLTPREADIKAADIAHSLAGKFRFGGHAKRRVTVAEHSVLVVELLCEMNQALEDERKQSLLLAGILHDGAEAYLVDVPKPVKVQPEFKWYREIEDRLQRMIFRAFNCKVDRDTWQAVKAADEIALGIEALTCMGKIVEPQEWKCLPAGQEWVERGWDMAAWDSNLAKRKFEEALMLIQGGHYRSRGWFASKHGRGQW